MTAPRAGFCGNSETRSGPASGAHDTASALLGDLASFRRDGRAANLSPRTTETYMDAASRLALFLAAAGMPTELAGIRREHVEAFVADQLERFKPTTAHNRYRGCQAFFRWAVDEGLVKESPDGSDEAAAFGRDAAGDLARQFERMRRGLAPFAADLSRCHLCEPAA